MSARRHVISRPDPGGDCASDQLPTQSTHAACRKQRTELIQANPIGIARIECAAPVVYEVGNVVAVVSLDRRNALGMRLQVIVKFETLAENRWVVRVLKIETFVDHSASKSSSL